jgi:putative PIN family toxin of toxin-antitoxin system
VRVVLDTSVVVSAVLIRQGNERRILDAWRRGAFDLVISPPLLEELGRVLSYPRIRNARWMTDAEVVELLGILAEDSVVVEGRLDVRASRDRGDDVFLATAVDGDADYLVSGDRDLLTLGSYRSVMIVRPAAFLALLGSGHSRR